MQISFILLLSGIIVSEKHEGGAMRDVKKVIPFKKLFAEHQIVTSLFRNMSQVNFITYEALLFALVCEIVLVMWLFFDIFLDERPPSLNGISYLQYGHVDLAVPIRLQKYEGERLMKAFVISALVWLTYWIFGGILHSAGDAVRAPLEGFKKFGL